MRNDLIDPTSPPAWLVHLVRAAALASEEMSCDGHPNWENGDDDPGDGPTAADHDEECDRCAWDALYQAVPQSVKAAAERAAARPADQQGLVTRPKASGEVRDA